MTGGDHGRAGSRAGSRSSNKPQSRLERPRGAAAALASLLLTAGLLVVLLGPGAPTRGLPAVGAQTTPTKAAPGTGTGTGSDHSGQGTTSGDDPVLTLLEQTPWVSSGGVFAARVAVSGAPTGATVEGALFPAVDSPDRVASSAAGDDLGRRLETLPEVPLGGDGGSVVVRVPIGREEADTPHIDLDPGVYPLAIDLFDASGDRTARLMTHVVVTDASAAANPAARRPVALVVRADQPFRMDSQGRLQLVGGPDALAGAVDRLRQATNVPLTLAATPGSLAALAEGSATAAGPAGGASTGSADGSANTTATPSSAATASAGAAADNASTPSTSTTSTSTTSTSTTGSSTSNGSTSNGSAAADAEQRARTEADLEQLATHAQVLGLPFASLPAGPWLTSGLWQALADQLQGGNEALTASFGAPPDATTWLVGPSDDPALLDWLGTRGVTTFLVPSDLASSSGAVHDDPVPSSGPFQLSPLQQPHMALRAEHVGPQAGAGDSRPHPIGDAYQLLASLAVTTVSSSGQGADDEQAVDDPAVLLVDDLSPAALPYLSTILAALGQPGPLAPTTVGALRQAIDAKEAATPAEDRSDPDTWELPASAPTDLGSLPADLAGAQAAIDSFVASVGANDPALLPLRRTVLAMGAHDLRPDERGQLRARVETSVQQALSKIEVGGEQPVTVTAHRSTLPLTVRNAGTRSLTVAVSVDSSDLELDGATTKTLHLDPGATSDLDIPVRINRSGDFRLRVVVTSPDGRVQLAERVVTVRSTAISGVGIVLSLGALLFLFVWWGRHVRRTRRGRRVSVAPPAPPPSVAVAPEVVQHQPVDEPVP